LAGEGLVIPPTVILKLFRFRYSFWLNSPEMVSWVPRKEQLILFVPKSPYFLSTVPMNSWDWRFSFGSQWRT
jgi:hypothetical protein